VSERGRYAFIDQLRGLVVVLMLVDHTSYYFNSVWLRLNPLDPLFDSWGQFALRYVSYLCAPGFLLVNGAMVWYAYRRRVDAGRRAWEARWHLIQRGLFLILLQLTWVNSSWGGFERLRPGHFGIIACIGLSMCLVTLLVHLRWPARLAIGLTLLAVHPLLLKIPYDTGNAWSMIPMQVFGDAGDFNKYPVLPWFVMAILGSVVGEGWLGAWKDSAKRRISYGVIIGLVAMAAATVIRLARGYGNLTTFSGVTHFSFLMDHKYPPSIYHLVWFFGVIVLAAAFLEGLGRISPKIPSPLGVFGRVPLFFYCVHIALLGIFSKRIGIYYRQGEVAESLIGLMVMLVVMYPLCVWFGGVKERSRNWFIRMI